MTFEWDENKNRINKEIHDGISFEYAARVFLDSKRIETIDETHSDESEENYNVTDCVERILFESIQSAAIIIFVFFLHKEQQQKRKNCIMKTMALDDLIKNPLTEEDKRIINSARPVVTEECPEITDAQIKKYKPWYEIHPNENDVYKTPVKKTAVSLKIDTDVLMALKEMGTGYKTRINDILRRAVFG